LTIAIWIMLSEDNRSMVHLCQEEVLQQVVQPALDDHKVRKDEPAPEGIFSASPNYNMRGSRVNTPEDPFDFSSC
jgi:hypothetical protein